MAATYKNHVMRKFLTALTGAVAKHGLIIDRAHYAKTELIVTFRRPKRAATHTIHYSRDLYDVDAKRMDRIAGVASLTV